MRSAAKFERCCMGLHRLKLILSIRKNFLTHRGFSRIYFHFQTCNTTIHPSGHNGKCIAILSCFLGGCDDCRQLMNYLLSSDHHWLIIMDQINQWINGFCKALGRFIEGFMSAGLGNWTKFRRMDQMN